MNTTSAFVTAFCCIILSGSLLSTDPVPNGEEVIKKMHQKWEGKWGKHMRFDQKVFLYKDDSLVKEEVWQEILSSPRKLQIRFNGFDTGNGILFRNDSVFHFADGNLVKEEKRVHHLLLLGFDVFFLPPSETIKQLQELGFDLSKSYETKDAYIIGTNSASDKTSSQFQIDKEQLYLKKVLLNRNGNLSEVELNNYQLIDSYPVATEISFKSNGKLTMKEEYFDISFPEEVDPEIFKPENFNELQW